MKINLASSLYDGQQVTIPSSMEMATNNGNLTLSLEQEKGTVEYPININYDKTSLKAHDLSPKGYPHLGRNKEYNTKTEVK